MMTMAMLAKAATFGGEARDWPMFIQTVKSMIHDVFPSDVQRLTMLSTMLAAPIREGMSQIFNTPLAYRAALHELHRKYGHPHFVVRSYIQHLMAISLDEGGSNLETFATQLNGEVATLDAAGYGQETGIECSFGRTRIKIAYTLAGEMGKKRNATFSKSTHTTRSECVARV